MKLKRTGISILSSIMVFVLAGTGIPAYGEETAALSAPEEIIIDAAEEKESETESGGIFGIAEEESSGEDAAEKEYGPEEDADHEKESVPEDTAEEEPAAPDVIPDENQSEWECVIQETEEPDILFNVVPETAEQIFIDGDIIPVSPDDPDQAAEQNDTEEPCSTEETEEGQDFTEGPDSTEKKDADEYPEIDNADVFVNVKSRCPLGDTFSGSINAYHLACYYFHLDKNYTFVDGDGPIFIIEYTLTDKDPLDNFLIYLYRGSFEEYEDNPWDAEPLMNTWNLHSSTGRVAVRGGGDYIFILKRHGAFADPLWYSDFSFKAQVAEIYDHRQHQQYFSSMDMGSEIYYKVQEDEPVTDVILTGNTANRYFYIPSRDGTIEVTLYGWFDGMIRGYYCTLTGTDIEDYPSDRKDESFRFTTTKEVRAGQNYLFSVGPGNAKQMGNTGSMYTLEIRMMDPDEQIPPPKAVANLKAKAAGNRTVALSWNIVDGADGYLILRGGKQIGYSMSTFFTDSQADPDNFNYYWVIPFARRNGKIIKGELGGYVWALGRVIGEIPGVTAEQLSKGSTRLRWKAADGANAYVILSKTGSEKAAFNPPVTVTGTQYTDKNRPSGKVMYYWVYGIYKNKNGAVSAAGKISPYAWAVVP